ncbi:MAG TPA: MBL fold metallo-hydrolase [Chloroflexota bacterium]|jgi:L-ascorbate metabolism protein UlaG (beta-lactamase superfamily)
MLGRQPWNRGVRSLVLLLSVVLASFLGFSGVRAQTPPNAAQGTVRLEWLGHEFYRLTSPDGVVVLTSPWLDNPDGPVDLDELTRTDVILVPNSHNDDMGNPIEVAAVSGATVVAPGPLGAWLIDNGLNARQFSRTNIGGQSFNLRDTLVKVGPSAHDNTLPNGADGGPAASYFIQFDNGFSVFYSGHATMVADLAIYASVYQPQIAILGLTEPPEFAQVARLMAMNNPKLQTIIPSHIRPGAPILRQAQQELDRVGLGELLFMPELRRPYEY